mmetsp:Transcript_66244/g.173683  ORF Transcript_66244/g.173683 Transcript_66244/m.173683 type:complete len:239 (-) Transcript_66244:26-742(-)
MWHSPPRLPPVFCRYLASSLALPEFAAMLLWFTTRASPRSADAFSSSGQSSAVSRKCERWFVCICVSQPSSVAMSGEAMTPALLQRTSRPLSPRAVRSSFAASRTPLKLMRSQCTRRTSQSGAASRTSARAWSERAEWRFSMMRLAAVFAITLAQMRPIPELQPVMATVLPCMLGRPLQNWGKCLDSRAAAASPGAMAPAEPVMPVRRPRAAPMAACCAREGRRGKGTRCWGSIRGCA